MTKEKSKKNKKPENKYWLDRERNRLKILDTMVDEQIKNIEKKMEQVAQNIENDIMHLYIKYAEDNQISYTKALEYLTNDKRREFQKDLTYYVDTYRDPEKALFYKKELYALSTRARVKRLEVLKANILKGASELHTILDKDVPKLFENVYSESYFYNIYTMQGVGVGLTFNAYPERLVETLLKHPWSGENYSSKVWVKTDNFARQIDRVMTQGLTQGKSIDELVFEMRTAILGKKGKGGRIYDYKRLVRTEASFIAEQATLQSYKDSNVNKYEFLATLDLRTSKVCQDLDGITFDVDKAIVGKNFPPMHSFCRSTTVPKIVWAGEEPEVDKRIARHPIGEYNMLIANMTYKEWKKRYIRRQ